MNLDNIDTVLYIEPNINEDERSYASTTASSIYGGDRINIDDPKLYSAFSFGKQIQQSITMERGMTCEVSDFGKWVVVIVGYNNTITGRSSRKTFLIVFKHEGDGMVMVASNKWRSISGVDQAISYIRSVANILKNETSKRL